jgi:hypothetical protein
MRHEAKLRWKKITCTWYGIKTLYKYLMNKMMLVHMS